MTPISLIRLACMADLHAICILAQELTAWHHQHAPEAFLPPGELERDQAHWQKLLSGPDSAICVAQQQEGDALVGFITVKIMPPTAPSFIKPRKICMIGSVVVTQAMRRHGVGRALLAAAQTWGRSQQADEIRLEVFDFNQGAIALYEAMGWRSQSRQMWLSL